MTKLTVRDFQKIEDTTFENIYNYTKIKFLTRCMTALSLMFRKGEFFFCVAIRDHMQELPAELQEECKLFFAQEGRHSLHHSNFNKILQEDGLNLQEAEDQAQARLESLGMSKEERLLTTWALEVWTAFGGKMLLRFGKPLMKDTETSRLWLYHATEEVEHACITPEVLEHCYYNMSTSRKLLHFFKTSVELLKQTVSNYKEVKRTEILCSKT